MQIPRSHIAAYARRHSRVNALRHFTTLSQGGMPPSAAKRKARAMRKASQKANQRGSFFSRIDRAIRRVVKSRETVKAHSPRGHALRRLWYHVMQKLAACSLVLLCASCSTQVITRPDGTRIANNNLLSRGDLTVSSDGTVSASGNAEAAAAELGKYGGKLIGAGVAKEGISAANSAVSTVTKAVTN